MFLFGVSKGMRNIFSLSYIFHFLTLVQCVSVFVQLAWNGHDSQSKTQDEKSWGTHCGSCQTSISLSHSNTHTFTPLGTSCCGVVECGLVKYSTGFDTSAPSIHPCVWKKTSHTLWERDLIEFTLSSLTHTLSHAHTHTHTHICRMRHIAWVGRHQVLLLKLSRFNIIDVRLTVSFVSSIYMVEVLSDGHGLNSVCIVCVCVQRYKH